MPRHTQRLRRMTSRLEGDHEDLELARMERMTDEELEAELVEIAVQSGFDADAAARWSHARAANRNLTSAGRLTAAISAPEH